MENDLLLLNKYIQAPTDGNWFNKLSLQVEKFDSKQNLWLASKSDSEQLLDYWIQGLSQFGRVVLVRAALAATRPTLTIWERGQHWQLPNIEEIIQSVTSGNIKHPKAQIEAVETWLRSPNIETEQVADATLDEAFADVDFLLPEFEYLHGEPSLWAIQSAMDCVATITNPLPHQTASSTIVAVLKAVTIGYLDKSIAPLDQVCQWISAELLQ